MVWIMVQRWFWIQGSQWVGVKKKETETAPGQAFGRFLDGFCAQIDREIREIREIRGMRGIRGIRLEKTRSA